MLRLSVPSHWRMLRAGHTFAIAAVVAAFVHFAAIVPCIAHADAGEPAAPDSALARVAPDSLAPRRPLGVADTVTLLPQVDVRDVRTIAPRRETATSVRLDRAGVTKFLPLTATDALVAVPGVDLIKTGPWASRISYRGLSGERVLVMVDGVRVNTVRGHGAQASLVPLDQLDEVELLPGATSAQFGSDALGGVVNLVTHRSLLAPESRLGLTLMARGAGPGGAWGNSVRTRWRTPDFGLELSAGMGALDALVIPEGRIPNSGNREDHLGARATARLGAMLVDLEHTRLQAHDVGLPAFGDAAGSTGMYPLQSRDATRLELSTAGHGAWPAARMLAVRQEFETHFDETTVDSAFLRGRFVGTVTNESGDEVVSPAWSLAPELRFGGFGALRINGEWRLEETSGPRQTQETVRNASGATTSSSTSYSESVPPARRDVWAAGAFASQNAGPWRFEAGARWDALRSRADSTANSSTSELDVTDERTSVEGGVSVRLGEIEPYFHAATGFRAPNLQERYYNDEIHGGMRLFGNPDLVAEVSESYEAGVRLTDAWGGRMRSLRFSAYRSNVDDMITLQYLGQLYLVPRFQYANVEHARLEGYEIAGQFQFGGTQVGVAVGLPRGVDLTTGEKLLDAGTGRATLDLSVPIGRVLPHGRFAARLQMSDALTGVDSSFARPSFASVALEASTILYSTRAVFAVRNLFDASYREPLSFIPEPGRTFAVSLRRDFDFALGH